MSWNFYRLYAFALAMNIIRADSNGNVAVASDYTTSNSYILFEFTKSYTAKLFI